MKSIIFTAVLCLFLSRISDAQSRVFGQDTLAIQHSKFQVRELVKFLPQDTALGTLSNTFGNQLSAITRALSSGRVKYLRVHLINGSCIANQNCGPYEIGYGYNLKSFEASVLAKNPKIITYVRNHTLLYCDLPNTKVLISPVVEHRLNNRAYRILADTIVSSCPSAQLVNNPVTGIGERYRGSWIESHSDRISGADIYSFDGVDATDSNIPLWKSKTAKAKISFVWSRVYNCRNLGPFQDPRNRTSCPKSRDFELLAHITDNRPPAPTTSSKCGSFKSPNIWKPLSEDKGTGDPRANLPVLLSRLGNGNTEIATYKGTCIGTLSYFGPPTTEGLGRYYSGLPGAVRLSGYEIEKKAVRLSGSPWVWVRQNNKCFGPFIPGMRQGTYR